MTASTTTTPGIEGTCASTRPDHAASAPASGILTHPLNGILLDERSGVSVRRVIGLLLARSREADFAVARIRLGAVDLTASELARVRRCRVLVGRFDVQSLTAAPADHAASLRALFAFLRSGRIEVRSAGGSGWVADFSVFRGLPVNAALPRGHACLVGAHSFWNVDVASGPAFTCMLGSPGATARADRRFDELWHRGYDVLPVLIQTVAAALGDAVAAQDEVVGRAPAGNAPPAHAGSAAVNDASAGVAPPGDPGHSEA
jgi:hypothetical protein